MVRSPYLFYLNDVFKSYPISGMTYDYKQL